MNKVIYLSMVFLLGAYTHVFAQAVSPDTTKSKLVFVGGLQYISNITYAGRRDATSVPIGVPTFVVASSNGLYFGAAGYFNASNGSFSADGFSLTPGYIFSIDQAKKLKLSISGTKYFFKSFSSIILSTFEGSADAALSYQPRFAKFTLNNSFQFGKQTNDIVNSLEISKDIPLVKSGKTALKISPAASFYSGTQSFSETYYTQTTQQRQVTTPGSGGGLGGLIPGQPGSTQTVSETVTEAQQREVKKYQALSLMGTLPVTLSVSKFQFSFTPYLIIPFNQVYSAESKTGNYFLFTGGMLYTF